MGMAGRYRSLRQYRYDACYAELCRLADDEIHRKA